MEKLSCKIARAMDSLFAIVFIKGMQHQERHQRVTCDLKDSPHFSFVKALSVVKVSFQEIGERDPFRSHQKAQESEPLSKSLYNSLGSSPVNPVGKASIIQAPAGNSLAMIPLTQKQCNRCMNGYKACIGRPSRTPYSGQGGLNFGTCSSHRR